MLLEKLLDGIEYEMQPKESPRVSPIEIADITSDSRRAGPGMLFVCLADGEKGNAYAVSAVRAGCTAVVAERDTGAHAPHVIVKDAAKANASLCANFFGRPAEKLKLVGVTGTNGKTTTAFLLRHILEKNGHKCGLIGTVQNMAGERVIPAHLTTPEPYELQRLFAEIAEEGCEYVVMETSSQALDQERLHGLRFEAGIFTNLTQDHLDYHKTMENYFAAKRKLFEQSRVAVLNIDDPWSARLREIACKTVTFSAKSMDADYTARNIRCRADGSEYELVGLGMIGRVHLSMPGGFNVYNSLAAVSCAVSLGLPLQGVLEAMKTARGAKGRLEVVELPAGCDYTVIIDFAHTPDSLEKTLKAVNGFKTGRLVCLFGCGGDRDKTKRPLMGKAAVENADFVIVTSDNPRTEEPGAIIDDILGGIKGTKTPFVRIENRREAIHYALEHAMKDDIILLAGKGHESYQIIGKTKNPFDEREIVAEELHKLGR